MIPTKEQWFWEQCGFSGRYVNYQKGIFAGWEYPNGEHRLKLPLVYLNSLFKYAVPVVIEKIMAEHECSSDLAYEILFKRWLRELQLDIPNATTALLKVCYKALGGKE